MKNQSENYLRYSDGELVFEEGSKDKSVYFIMSGKVEVSQHIGGRKTIISILHKGNYLGEMAALNDDVRSVTARAIGELYLYELSLGDMIKNMQKNPELLTDVWTSLARRLRDTDLKVRELDSRMRELASQTPKGNENAEDWMAGILNLDSLNILLVHNNTDAVVGQKDLFRDEYNFFAAPDGRSALHLMKYNDIALIISASRLPDMSGAELLERAQLAYPDTIRMIIGSYPDQRTIMKSVDAVHVHEVLMEPWRYEEVKFTITRWIGQYRKNMRLEEATRLCKLFRSKLESANDLILELIKDLRDAYTLEQHQRSFWQRWLKVKARQRETELEGVPSPFV